MPTATLKKVTKELGLSQDDLVRYHKHNDTAIIEVDLKKAKTKTRSFKKDPIAKLGKTPVHSGVSDGSINHDKYLYRNNP